MQHFELLVLLLVSILILVCLTILIIVIRNSNDKVSEKIETVLNSQLRDSRLELSSSLKDSREELTLGLHKNTERMESWLRHLSEVTSKESIQNRTEMASSLSEFKVSFSESVQSFKALQREKFQELTSQQEKMIRSTEQKLEKMRETVDEKLHKTLEERLGQSFKLVSERLEAVQKGLGEMQTLAMGVGDLKKVLTNVKTRGVLGEIQLENILEQILTIEQYSKNVKTSSRYNGHVEFAIKMPGKDSSNEIYLPIDAKFPQEDYVRLQKAYDEGDIEGIEVSKRALVKAVKLFAKDISQKYLDPPNTTDFGIMFLPVEGLYAELVRQPDLLTYLQREYKIALTGPTTLAAFLNSLQMGFRTLALQRRSSDIQKTLEAVRTQFGLFGSALKKAQDRIKQADRDIETLVTTRTNVMLTKLKGIEELSLKESQDVLEIKD